MSEPTATPGRPLAPAGFSVLILTLNEERQLPDCLASVSRCDDIVVLDSGSTDRTAEIARAAGARVFARPFDHFAGQRNYAQREIPFKYPWVFHLDADERLTPELRVECGGAVWEDVDGFLATPKVLWNGKWVRRSSKYPSPELRFVRAPEFEFVTATEGASHQRIGELVTCYLHHVCSNGELDGLERSRRHAECAARRQLEAASDAPVAGPRADAVARSPAMPKLRDVMAAGPLLRFLSRYVLRAGFRDGRAGFQYCRHLARYEALKRAELRRFRGAR